MQFRAASMSAMLAITKHGVCVGIIAPCLVNVIMTGMDAVQNWPPRLAEVRFTRANFLKEQ